MKILSLAILMCIAQALCAQNKIPYLNETLKIDGKPNEAVWSTLQPVGEFEVFFPEEEKTEQQTEVKLFHNKENLYVFAKYYDTTEQSEVTSLKRDQFGDIVVRSDSFSIILDPSNQQNSGYYFAVNDGNAQFDGLINFGGGNYDFSSSWNNVWKSATAQDGTVKMYEFEIPLRILSFNPSQNEWGITLAKRDFKNLKWSAYSNGLERNNQQFDLRFTNTFQVEDLPKVTASKFTLTPSLTATYNKNVDANTHEESIIPSLDLQYNVTSSLKLDATINPDFSQVDIDAPVTNLTRFAVNFPERRNFFVENSDLFNNLGNVRVNSFYSRRIGSQTDMLYGVKLSGNVLPKTRVGLLNSQTKSEGDIEAQNYTVGVVQQQLSNQFTATSYLVNQQDIENLSFGDIYNRVAGAGLNFKTEDAKYSAKIDYGKSFSNGISKENNLYNFYGRYFTQRTGFRVRYSKVERNFITKAGFNPRIYNFDALTNTRVRQDYSNFSVAWQQNAYPKTGRIQRYRWGNIENNMFFNQDGEVSEARIFWGHSLWTRGKQNNWYFYPSYKYENLQFSFDLLGNGNPIVADKYNNVSMFAGFSPSTNRSNFYYSINAGYGGFYSGTKAELQTNIGYRFMPKGKFELFYNPTRINLKELGEVTYHTVNSSTELFLSNRMNWSTYVQYNPQAENFNLNSRLQWEYRPLSYLYVVLTDRMNKNFDQKNYGVAVKANYRLNI